MNCLSVSQGLDEKDPAFGQGERLVAHLAQHPSCLVAFSGGVDSAVVAMAAHKALQDRAVALTGVSASLASGELETARRVAAQIGVVHCEVPTDEFSDSNYLANAPNRCFHCKTELYRTLRMEADNRQIAVIVNGANADDLSDFRPGMQAAADFGVRSPLAELGFGKEQVRSLARLWSLEVWDKPATPCLSSRVAYGLNITPERLARIDGAEQFLRELGFATIRVRYHENDLARIEAPLGDIVRLCDESTRARVVSRLSELGFRYITLDIQGFRSGSFQQLVPLETLEKFRSSSPIG